MRYKNKETDKDGKNHSDKYHTSRDIFGALGVKMIFVGEEVNDGFYCGIYCFCYQHGHNSKADHYPFNRLNFKKEPGDDYKNGEKEMKSKIWLGCESIYNTIPSVFERY